jgi:hypothetical protein
MVADVEAEDNLIQLRLLDSDTLVAERRRELSQEVRQSDRPHVKLTHWIVFRPGILECLDVLLLKRQDVILILSLLVIVETFTDDGNEDVHEDEEGHELECGPEEDGEEALTRIAVMHDTIPRLSGRGTEECHHGNVEGLEVDVAINEVSFFDCAEQTHTGHTEGEQDQCQKGRSVEDVAHGHEQCLQQCSQTLGRLDHSEETRNSHDPESGHVEVKRFKQLFIDCDE